MNTAEASEKKELVIIKRGQIAEQTVVTNLDQGSACKGDSSVGGKLALEDLDKKETTEIKAFKNPPTLHCDLQGYQGSELEVSTGPYVRHRLPGVVRRRES